MLIGVLVQIVHVIADAEKEKAMIESVAGHLRGQWEEKGYGADEILRKDKFKLLLLDANIALFLTELGVDMVLFVEMADVIYEDISKGGVSFETFVNAVLNLRGANPVTVCDIKKQLQFIKKVVKESSRTLEGQINKQFLKCSKQINSVRKVVLGEDESDEDSVDSQLSHTHDCSDIGRTHESLPAQAFQPVPSCYSVDSSFLEVPSAVSTMSAGILSSSDDRSEAGSEADFDPASSRLPSRDRSITSK